MIKILSSKKFWEFILAGAVSTLLSILILEFQTKVLNFNLSILEVVFVPNVIASAVAIFIGFYFQKKSAFKTNIGNSRNQLYRYVLIQLINLVVFEVFVFDIFFDLSNQSSLVAKILTIIVMTIWNYFIYNKFVFKK